MTSTGVLFGGGGAGAGAGGGVVFAPSGSSRGHVLGALPSCTAVCGAVPPVCPALPCVPEQGAVMPVLYNPSAYTELNNANPTLRSTYTLNLVTTSAIHVGICLRFQMYDGVNYTYITAKESNAIAQWDLVVSTGIPAGTIVVVAVTPLSTSLVDFSGLTVFATGGPGVSSAYLNAHNTTLCWAFAPTATGGWTPAIPEGQPMFAIGYKWSAAQTGPSTTAPCSGPPPGPAETAPNFPDQWLYGVTPTWTFLYQVVFPLAYTQQTTVSGVSTVSCITVEAFKVQSAADSLSPVFVSGEWSNLRDILAQPFTMISPTITSPSRWVRYDVDTDNANVGPFIIAPVPGQLAVVYFQPRQLDTGSTGETPATATGSSWQGPGRLAMLVTSPIPPRTSLYFTVLPYNSLLGGFGPRDTESLSTAAFVDHAPSFVWITGSCPVPAGTVVFIDNIGSGTEDPTIVDAHNTTANRVGAIVGNTLTTMDGVGTAVPSICVVSDWVNFASTGSSRSALSADRFVTAVISDQYSGDQVPLSPMLTMPRTRTHGAIAFGLNRRFDNTGLPGTVQAAIINSSTYTTLTEAESGLLVPGNMPVFEGMTSFRW